jgi:hypothetical protein
MADEELRRLHRDATAGDALAEARLLVERLRVGSLRRDRVEFAARIGFEPARLALGNDAPPETHDAHRVFFELACLGRDAWEEGVRVTLRFHTTEERPLRWQTVEPTPLCSGLSPDWAVRLQQSFDALGCLTHTDPDDDVSPDQQRAPASYATQEGDAPGSLTLVLDDCGHRKIGAIKEIRTVTGFGLREAKDIADRVGAHLPWNWLVFGTGDALTSITIDDFATALAPWLLG